MKIQAVHYCYSDYNDFCSLSILIYIADWFVGFFGKAKKFFALEDEANTDVTTFRAEPVTTVEAASSIEFFEPQCLGTLF